MTTRLSCACAAGLLVFALPAAVEGQFAYTTNNGAITIAGYSGPGGTVIVPSEVNGLPVTSIGGRAFFFCGSMTNVVIPNSVTSIGEDSFSYCGLTSVIIPDSVTSIGTNSFHDCFGLFYITIGDGVTNIEESAFSICTNLKGVYFQGNAPSVGSGIFDGDNNATVYYLAEATGWGPTFAGRPAVLWNPQVPYNYTTNNGMITITGYTGPGGAATIPGTINGLPVTSIGDAAFENDIRLARATIPNSVTSIGTNAFGSCLGLAGVYFAGNAPAADSSVFADDFRATVYYLPGTTGWSTNFAGRPTLLWTPQVETSDAGFGMRTNQFGFTINWASGMTVVVEASANLANPVWTPLATNTLTTGSAYFNDPQWANYPSRFYRLRWP